MKLKLVAVLFFSVILFTGCTPAASKKSSTTISPATKMTSSLPKNTTGSSPTPATVTTALTTYTLAQVSQHKTVNDCWLVIDSNVYDVSNYISQHPNMDILQGCGTDATALFNQVGKHQGIQAQNMLPQLKIGELKV